MEHEVGGGGTAATGPALCARRRRLRRTAFGLVLALLLAVALEIALRLTLGRLASRHNVYWEPPRLTAGQARLFATEYHHPSWGWDLLRPRRGAFDARIDPAVNALLTHTAEPAGGEPGEVLATTFGDSFTHGDGLGDEETWQHHLTERTGGAWLNFGVPAYGTDQAVLKHRETDVQATYAVLAVLDENIARGVTVWWPFYMPRGGFPGTKPRFESRGGSVVLVPNPLPAAGDAPLLGSEEFIDRLRAHDEWERWHESTGAPARPSALATWTVVRHAGFFARSALSLARAKLRPAPASLEWPHRFYRLYHGETEGLRVLRHAVSQFVGTARCRGERPVVLLFPVRRSVEILRRFGVRPYAPIAEHARSLDCTFVDFGDLLAASQDLDADYIGGDGHFTAQAAARIARELERRLREDAESAPLVCSPR